LKDYSIERRIMAKKESHMFVVMPQAKDVDHADLSLVLSQFLLMKLAGQVTVSMQELRDVGRDYAGYTLLYRADTESFTLTLKTRPEEFPRPEPTSFGPDRTRS
jgi:hypothetical protein